jgi:hypothetical protein
LVLHNKYDFVFCNENSLKKKVLDHQHLVQQRPSPPQSLVNPLHSILSVRSLMEIPSIISRHDDQKSVSNGSTAARISANADRAVKNLGNINMERTRIYRSRTPLPNEDSCPLDPNHTHFILLDDMFDENMEMNSNELTRHINCRADLTIKLRAEIEREISESKINLMMN